MTAGCHCEELSFDYSDEAISYFKTRLLRHRYVRIWFLAMTNIYKMIKAIIFDLGNVLIGFDHRIAVNRILARTDKSARDIYDFFFDSPLTQNFEKGLISPEDFFRQVKSELDLRINYEEFLPVWNEIFFRKPEMEEFIQSLDAGIRLVLLSNVNRLHYEYLEKNFSCALTLFDKVMPSYVTGSIKPERRIYELALKETEAQIDEVVYVDDRADLIEAARSYGINSARFTGVENLKREFDNLGIPFIKEATFNLRSPNQISRRCEEPSLDMSVTKQSRI